MVFAMKVNYFSPNVLVPQTSHLLASYICNGITFTSPANVAIAGKEKSQVPGSSTS
jgi:hypothetical protein